VTLTELLDTDPLVRREAVERVTLDAAGLFALRERLLEDSHGSVRAAAAERLARAARARFDEGPPSRTQLSAWLIEALADPLPSVREIGCRAVARHLDSSEPLEARLAEMLTRDPQWRVRRAAARALAAVAGEAAIPPLIAGLADPFWRVRHGVITALGLIVSRSPSHGPSQGDEREDERARLREKILRAGAGLHEAARAALAYLASGWPEGEDEVPEVLGIIRDPGAGLELGDADPAVVTARLQASEDGQLDPDKLVELLAESHQPLREEAARRLARLEDPSCLVPALAWLEDPRVANAPAIVRRLLDRLGARARGLAEHALACGRAGAIIWAAGWVGCYAAEDLHLALLEHAQHPRAEVRGAILAAFGKILARERGEARQGAAPGLARSRMRASIEAGLDDRSGLVRDAAALALLESGERPGLTGERFAGFGPFVRVRLLAVVDHAELWAVALDDPDVRVRVAALGACPVLSPELRARALADDDPWIRRAALDLDAAIASFLGGAERDGAVRRAAARILVRARASLEAPLLRQLHTHLAADADAWVRARAAELVEPGSCEDEALARLLLATRDTAAMVRASASARLDRVPDLAERLERLLAHAEDTALRRASWSRLVTELDEATAAARLDVGLVSETDPQLHAHLRELATLFDAAMPELRAEVTAEVQAASAVHADSRGAPSSSPSLRAKFRDVARRPLGRSGLELAPLVVSGRFSPSPGLLARAVERGVDTLFWEPRYTSTTRLLREPKHRDLQVIAGSFHADRRSLLHDLELTRRRLRRDQVDLFLLFWVRSPARLGPEALDALREFQARGWIRSYGFSTHDRAIACAAIETGDWPVLMTRHSAAHDGAEAELFPAAAAAGVGVLSFSALCYGRMLRPSSVFASGPAAPDCYRYSLSQPAVAACISAPQTRRELLENLEVLERPTLESTAAQALRAHGREIYADNKRFDRLLRRGGTAPLREAILELFEQASEPPEPAPSKPRREAGPEGP
jgi:HEAT repeat protein